MAKIMDYSVSSNPSWSYKVLLNGVMDDKGIVSLDLVDAKTKEPIISLIKNIEPRASFGYAYVNNDFFVDNLEFLEKNKLGTLVHKTKVYRNQTYQLVKLDIDNIIDKANKFLGAKGEREEGHKPLTKKRLNDYKNQIDKNYIAKTKITKIEPKRKCVDSLSME